MMEERNTITCIIAQSIMCLIAPYKPCSNSNRIAKAGENSKTFILIDTAKL